MAGAAPTSEAARQAIALLHAQDTAILRVGERLITRGTAFCRGPGYSAGMIVQQLSQYGADYRAAASAMLGINDRPTVAVVAEGGAAARAGLRVGDGIMAIDGHSFADRPAARRAGDFASIAQAHDVIDSALTDGRAELSIVRGDATPTVSLIAARACHARFDVRAGRANNASSDGTYVQVSSDLVAQAQGDGELAAILAHELAHSILRHPQRLRGPAPRPKVRDTETEADRLSVYLLDAAGYPSAAAVAFWARWGRANDLGIFADGSHPGWKSRIRAIEAEAAVITARRASGEPIRPPADLTPR